jgi:regulator of replication initiation timing
MEAEFESLENKLNQLLKLSTRLRAENHTLRQELATSLSYGKHCDEKINNAQARLERLLVTIPTEQK